MLRAIPVNSLVNNFFADFDRSFRRTGTSSEWAAPTDVVRYEDRVEIHFDLPGVAAEDIDLTVENRHLSLKAERPAPAYEGGSVVGRERWSGLVQRQLYLSDSLDPEGLTAVFSDGVLSVTLPVAEAVKPRKVAIASAHPVIEAPN